MSRLQKILDHTYFLFLPYKGNDSLEFLNFDLHFHIQMNMATSLGFGSRFFVSLDFMWKRGGEN